MFAFIQAVKYGLTRATPDQIVARRGEGCQRSLPEAAACPGRVRCAGYSSTTENSFGSAGQGSSAFLATSASVALCKNT